MNLRLDHLQVTHGGGAGPAELALQQLDVHHDGVDGILDLVADARGEELAQEEICVKQESAADAAAPEDEVAAPVLPEAPAVTVPPPSIM